MGRLGHASQGSQQLVYSKIPSTTTQDEETGLFCLMEEQSGYPKVGYDNVLHIGNYMKRNRRMRMADLLHAPQGSWIGGIEESHSVDSGLDLHVLVQPARAQEVSRDDGGTGVMSYISSVWGCVCETVSSPWQWATGRKSRPPTPKNSRAAKPPTPKNSRAAKPPTPKNSRAAKPPTPKNSRAAKPPEIPQPRPASIPKPPPAAPKNPDIEFEIPTHFGYPDPDKLQQLYPGHNIMFFFEMCAALITQLAR
ncbi:hypothetical protein J6590_035583 [Homalodisca vitripennis]|nr:hypothetical protein J6590_035583 [Homalodisca vitripennis]